VEPWTAFIPKLLAGLKNTILVTLWAYPIAVAIAFVVAIVRIWRIPVLSSVLQAYVEFIRSTPLVMQLFYVFFALPFLGIRLESLKAAIFTFAVHYGAYMSESVRGTILSVDRGQWEAGTTLNLSRFQVTRLIIVPQALRMVVPILANDLVDLFKNSSLAALVAVPELAFVGRVEALRTFQTVLIYSLIAGFYFIVSYPATVAIRLFEHRVAVP
jgi:His/Glu/Gln/Arg/opine family amino acid ABC transporter permease subunit